MRKVLQNGLRNSGKKYFHGAPTHQQAKGIFWKRLKHDTALFRSKQPSESELYVTLLNGTEIHVIGLDKPERVEGQPWDGCHITEIGNVKDGAWPENIRPVLSDTGGFALLDGVPEGRNHYFDLAIYAAGGALPETLPIVGSYAENPHDAEWCYYHWFSSDVLPQSEINAVRLTLDERTYRQEYEGSFESYEGLAYYAFHNANLSDCGYNKNEVVHIGMDFNLNPMSATFNHVRGDTVHQFGEAYLNHSNTNQMIEHIKSKFNSGMVRIYPDSTGKAGHTSAAMSDIAMLKQAGFKVLARPSNPRQKDRINAVNSLMKPGGLRPRYYVNAKNCPKTVNDWNRVESLPDGRLNKKQEDSGLVHISDAEGYLINYLFSIKKPIYGGIPR